VVGTEDMSRGIPRNFARFSPPLQKHCCDGAEESA
jgi:hypothetical protein